MNFEIENYSGFDFVKFGFAEWCDKGIVAKYEGKDIECHAAINVMDNDFLIAEQSVYIVKVKNEIKYVGVYSDTFKSRWLKADRYFWHSENLDNKIDALIREGLEVTFWLSIDPYMKVNDGHSLALEYELINQLKPDWNTTHKGDNLSKKRMKVKDIVNKIAIGDCA